MRRTIPIVLLLSLACLAPAWAKLPKADRKEAKDMLRGPLYMRVEAPYASGRHQFGVYEVSLVEVSPESVKTDTEGVRTGSLFHTGTTTYWGIRINDPVELEELEFDDDEVEIELEGTGPARDEKTVIKFVDIHSLADFRAAFEQAFSRVPLQDEHPDWPPEVKEAIADRRLMDGMTKRQVYLITGAPERFEKSTEEGVEVEVWWLRQDKGMKHGVFTFTAGETENQPVTLRFENGLLVGSETSGGREQFKLDD